MNDRTLNEQAKTDEQTVWMALSLVWELGYLIAIPAFAFGFGGAYLDTSYDTSPIFLLLGLLLALLLSSFAVYRRVKAITSRL